MSWTSTSSSTFTRTHARYLASKVAADLRQLQRFYGRPGEADIGDYVEELTTLLAGGYLDYVEYGFQRDGCWIIALRYTARAGSDLEIDDRPGRVYAGADVSGTSWSSYLVRNRVWWSLSATDRESIEASIPVKRQPAGTPGLGDGVWVEDKVYARNGVALPRRMFQPR